MLSQHGVPIASRSYRAFKTRPASARARRDERVMTEIRRVHEASGGRYGARKVYWQLRREDVAVDGAPIARCTVERLMKAAGLQGVSRRETFRTTRPDPAAQRPEDLVQRQFTADRPNQLWVVDFTYVASFSGFVYVAFAIDVFSRMIVGWHAARTMRTELPLDALDMALWHRSRLGQPVTGLIHHSDAGSQYVSMRYTARLLDAGARLGRQRRSKLRQRAGREPDRRLQGRTCPARGPVAGLDDLELATLTWVDWYNHARLHESLGYRPPAEVEAEYYRHLTLPEQPLAGEPARH